MARILLTLLILAAFVAAGVSLLRRIMAARRGPSIKELVAATKSAALLPAPDSLQPNEQGTLTRAEVFTKLHGLAFGVTPIDPPASPAHAEVAEAASLALKDAVNEPRYTPRRPLLLPQLMHAINDTDVSRRELAALIVRDPALTGSLLKMANAPFYRASSEPVESMDRAIALLGTEGIRSLIANAVMQPVFRVTGGEFARFPEVTWEHTFRSGTAAAAHAAMVEHSDPFAAQLVALITGLAAIIVFRVTLDQYAARPGVRPDVVIIAHLLDAHTAAIAHNIAVSWDLSERIRTALQEQASGSVPDASSALGRSLHFGHFVGALAVLRTNGDIGDDAAKASLHVNEGDSAQIEGIWTRLAKV